jgi:predicted DNA-binding mobile mystery protein A
MLTRLQSLQSAQIEAALNAWRAAKLPARPAQGWVRAIREALGMPANIYAQKLGITGGGLASLEKAEASQTITLASLHKLADALGCELQYALVPRRNLQEQLRERATTLADAQLRPIAHSMALEDQAVQGQARQLQRDMLIQELLNGSRRQLWASK